MNCCYVACTLLLIELGIIPRIVLNGIAYRCPLVTNGYSPLSPYNNIRRYCRLMVLTDGLEPSLKVCKTFVLAFVRSEHIYNGLYSAVRSYSPVSLMLTVEPLVIYLFVSVSYTQLCN